jgi:putative flippase GtrA
MATLVKLFVGVPLLVGLIAAFAMLRGWTVSILWEWFLVPLGLPALGIAHAIGISLAVAFLTHQTDTKKDDRESQEAGLQIFTQVLTCLGTLGVGWIVMKFM